MKLAPNVVFPRDTQLLSIEGFRPEGFVFGIEILNDNQTTMEFVVWVLEAHVGLDQQAAAEKMVDIHTKGGALLRMESAAEAERVAALVTACATERNYPLVCRSVSAHLGDAAGQRGR